MFDRTPLAPEESEEPDDLFVAVEETPGTAGDIRGQQLHRGLALFVIGLVLLFVVVGGIKAFVLL